MTVNLDTLAIVRDQSTRLIRAELHSANQRTMLEHAVYDAIIKLGCDISEVSEASGLTPAEIRRILATEPFLST